FAELGLQFPPALETVGPFMDAAQSVVAAVNELPGLTVALVEAIEDEDIGEIVSKSVELIDVVRTVITGIDTLATALQNAGASTGLPASEVAAFAAELPQRLLEYLVARNLEVIPGAAEALEFIGLLERTDENVGSTDPTKPPYVRRVIHLDQLVAFLESPLDHLETLYGWGSS